MKFLRTIASFALLILGSGALAQCIVINEIMINAAGPNDGVNAPNSEEWVELYNTCSTDVNVGCYVLTDGDFTVTIPSGTVMPANSYLTIGSGNAGFTVDINWASCGCSSGANIGVFTNGNEQLILTDGSTVQDAIIWGVGQLPMSINSIVTPGCFSTSISANGSESYFEQLPTGGANGCTLGRNCDGSSTWIEFCDPAQSPGESNGIGDVIVGIASSEQNICTDDCVNFSDDSNETSSAWNWTFEGSSTATSPDEQPFSICYPTAGVYDVTLEVSSTCGVISQTFPNYITVSDPSPSPLIDANGPLTFCDGESVVLATASVGPYQWSKNGIAIAGATTNQYTATTTGTYALTVGSGNCPGISADIIVTVDAAVVGQINPGSNASICEGDTYTFSALGIFETYQWYENGNAIAGAASSTYSTGTSGDYTVGSSIRYVQRCFKYCTTECSCNTCSHYHTRC